MQKNQRVFDSSYLIFLLALFFVVVLWWYGLSLRSFIFIDSEWRKTFSISSANKRGVAGRNRTLGCELWCGRRKSQVSAHWKNAYLLENFSLPSLSSASASGHLVFLQTSLFRQTPACILNTPPPMGENLQLALPARRLITIPEVFFCFSCFVFPFFSPFDHVMLISNPTAAAARFTLRLDVEPYKVLT